MRAIAGSILILAAVLFHRSPTASGPLGFGLLWLMVLMGVWYLISDLADADHPRHVVDVASRVWRRSLISRTRFWRWLTNGHNCLIKGTVIGALVGALANLAFVGPSNIGNLAAIPGAFLGLVVGLIFDSIAHRQRYRQSPQPSAAEESNQPVDPFGDE